MPRAAIRLVVLAAMTAMFMAVGAGAASAGEHNQKSCEADGGTWTNDQGTKNCDKSETDVGKNEKFECTTTSETSGQGNLGNKTGGPTEETSGEPTGSGNCPPGQHK